MKITKKPQDFTSFHLPWIAFPRARDAFRSFLRHTVIKEDGMVLLPAFVGHSEREGSGVFDPVREIDAKYAFYKVHKDLSIDLQDVSRLLNLPGNKLLVIIHYYGFPARGGIEASQLARSSGATILEDEAHALFSDLIGGSVGRLGDASIFSYSKMFPVSEGGGIRLGEKVSSESAESIKSEAAGVPHAIDLAAYDLLGISKTRIYNAEYLLSEMGSFRGLLRPLWNDIPKGVTPQTLPVIVIQGDRTDLYFEMNEAGFGAVSLYHNLVNVISPEEYPDSFWLSERILNLPVHQDITHNMMQDMVRWLEKRSR